MKFKLITTLFLGPHVGRYMIWPMSITMRALTFKDDQEIKWCIELLRKTHAGT